MDLDTLKKKSMDARNSVFIPRREFLIKIESQQKYLDEIYKYKEQFNWRKLRKEKICPVDGQILEKTIMCEDEEDGFTYDCVIYKCQCGYEYAIYE